MEPDQVVENLRAAINKFSILAPTQVEFVEFILEALDAEVRRGVRKTYVKRMLAELNTYARNVLTPCGYQAYQADGSKKHPAPEEILKSIIAAGKIKSDAEHAVAMEVIDSLLQNPTDLSDEQARNVAAMNALLAQYEAKLR